MKNYKAIGKIGEGTFSEVMKIQNLRDGNHYACKQMKQRFESIEQVNNLREIQALRRLNPHPNILTLHQVVFDRKSGSLALICELMDMNIYELIRGRRHPLSEKKVRHYMYQLCKSLDHMHRNGIFHRDVKPENILVKEWEQRYEAVRAGFFLIWPRRVLFNVGRSCRRLPETSCLSTARILRLEYERERRWKKHLETCLRHNGGYDQGVEFTCRLIP